MLKIWCVALLLGCSGVALAQTGTEYKVTVAVTSGPNVIRELCISRERNGKCTRFPSLASCNAYVGGDEEFLAALKEITAMVEAQVPQGGVSATCHDADEDQ